MMQHANNTEKSNDTEREEGHVDAAVFNSTNYRKERANHRD